MGVAWMSASIGRGFNSVCALTNIAKRSYKHFPFFEKV